MRLYKPENAAINNQLQRMVGQAPRSSSLGARVDSGNHLNISDEIVRLQNSVSILEEEKLDHDSNEFRDSGASDLDQ